MAWNPADKSVNIGLSNNNRTATRIGANDASFGARSLTTALGIKRYIEIYIDSSVTAPFMSFGLANANWPLNFVGIDTNSVSYYQQTGQKYTNNIPVSFGSNWAADGLIIGMAYDPVVGSVWFSRNNVWQSSGDPASGLNPAFTNIIGDFFAAISLYRKSSPSHAITANFVTTDLIYDPPIGFFAWDLIEYPTIQIKRGTKSQIETAKSVGDLLLGEPYLITDEGRFALGTAINDYTSFAKQTELDAKQATLVSGTTIKTINGESLLGSGDLITGATISDVTISDVIVYAIALGG